MSLKARGCVLHETTVTLFIGTPLFKLKIAVVLLFAAISTWTCIYVHVLLGTALVPVTRSTTVQIYNSDGLLDRCKKHMYVCVLCEMTLLMVSRTNTIRIQIQLSTVNGLDRHYSNLLLLFY